MVNRSKRSSQKGGPAGTATGGKPAGIKDIAKRVGVSIGTVDRALHGRPGINALTRTKVLQTAEQLGYRPNLAARFLKSGRLLRVSAHLPVEIASFYDLVREGIRETARLLENAVTVEFRSHPHLAEGEVEIFEQAILDGGDGIIVAPGHPAELKHLIRRAAQRGMPVVCVSTDAPESERLTGISADPFTSGAVAGELLCRYVQGILKFAVFTGDLSTIDHAEKLRGFQESVRDMCAAGEIGAVIETHDDERHAYAQAKQALSDHPEIRGVYVSTANSPPVLQAVGESGRAPGIAVVTTDLFPELVEPIRTGRVLATIHQRPRSQGRMSLRVLYQFLVEGFCPPPRIKLIPHLVMRSNLELFLDDAHGEGDLPNEHPESRPVRHEPQQTNR